MSALLTSSLVVAARCSIFCRTSSETLSSAGESRRGGESRICLLPTLDNGEFRTCCLRDNDGDMLGLVAEAFDVFFLIDKGSMALELFGVASVLPVGLNGCRLLLGNGEGLGGSIESCSPRSGVLGRGSNRAIVASRTFSMSMSMGGVAMAGIEGLNGGKGEGGRGPSGRLSAEWRDSARLLNGEGERGVGVMDRVVGGVFERKLIPSRSWVVAVDLEARDKGRAGKGGSSERINLTSVQGQMEEKGQTFIYRFLDWSLHDARRWFKTMLIPAVSSRKFESAG